MADRHAPDNGVVRAERHDAMTDDQRLYLSTLCSECGEPVPVALNHRQANDLIADLQIRTGRPLD